MKSVASSGWETHIIKNLAAYMYDVHLLLDFNCVYSRLTL